MTRKFYWVRWVQMLSLLGNLRINRANERLFWASILLSDWIHWVYEWCDSVWVAEDCMNWPRGKDYIIGGETDNASPSFWGLIGGGYWGLIRVLISLNNHPALKAARIIVIRPITKRNRSSSLTKTKSTNSNKWRRNASVRRTFIFITRTFPILNCRWWND